MFDWRKQKILITGGTGLVGKNLADRLLGMGLDVFSIGTTRGEYRFDLRNQEETKSLFDFFAPSAVFHLAAKVGGIYANSTNKADFYLENTLINTNVVCEIQKREIPFVFAMGTGCAYPKRLENHILHEEDFLDGIPEVTNDAYAYSKRNLLVHLKALKDTRWIYCIPANIYGPWDNFHLMGSHVVPALINKCIDAKSKGEGSVEMWGSGCAQRDFLYVEDLVDAMILACDKNEIGEINVATGVPASISSLMGTIMGIIGFKASVVARNDFPEGQTIRIFDVQKISRLGWFPKHDLRTGLEKTIRWYIENRKESRN